MIGTPQGTQVTALAELFPDVESERLRSALDGAGGDAHAAAQALLEVSAVSTAGRSGETEDPALLFLLGAFGDAGVGQYAVRAVLGACGGNVSAALERLLAQEAMDDEADPDSDDEDEGGDAGAAEREAAGWAGPKDGAAVPSLEAGGAGPSPAWCSAALVPDDRPALHSGSAAFPDVLGMARAQERAEADAVGGLDRFARRVATSMSDEDLVAAALAAGIISEADASLLCGGGSGSHGSWLEAAGGGSRASSGPPAGRSLEAVGRLLFSMDQALVASAWEATGRDEAAARALLREWDPDGMATAELLEAEAVAVGAIPADGSASLAAVEKGIGADGSGRKGRRARAEARRRERADADAAGVRNIVRQELRGSRPAPRPRATGAGGGMAAALRRAEAEAEASRRPAEGSTLVGERVGVSGSTHQRDVLAMDVATPSFAGDGPVADTRGVLGAAVRLEPDTSGAETTDGGDAWVVASRRQRGGTPAPSGGRAAPRGASDGSTAAAGARTHRHGGSMTAEEARAQAQFSSAQRQVLALRTVRRAILREASRSHGQGNGAMAAAQAERAQRLRDRIRSAQREAADATLRIRNAHDWAAQGGAGGHSRALAEAEDAVAHAVGRGEDPREAARRAGLTHVVFLGRRAVVPEGGSVDLHGQLAGQGVRLLRDVILPAARRDRVSRFDVITGRGAHSSSGRSRLRGAVEAFLRSASGITFSARSAAAFSVRLR